MKIKQDFITNSSSSSYISFIPNSIDIEKLLWTDKITSFTEKQLKLIRQLCSGDSIYSSKHESEERCNDEDDLDCFSEEDFSKVLNFISKNNFPYYYDDCASEECYKIDNIANSNFGKEIKKIVIEEYEREKNEKS